MGRLSAYADKRDDATLTIELVKLEQGNDTPFEFYKKIQKILNAQICYSNLNYGLSEELNSHFERVALKTLLNGLKEPLGSLMRTKDPVNLDTALNLLTNTYQKEITSQKYNRTTTNNNIQKSRPNFNRQNSTFPTPFMISPQTSFYQPTNVNYSRNNNSNANQNNGQRQQPLKRPANFGYSQQTVRQIPPNSDVTPMSISTNNTYRPPMKIRPNQNYHHQELYEIEDEDLSGMNLNQEQPDEIDYTPYNDFLEQSASEEQAPVQTE